MQSKLLLITVLDLDLSMSLTVVSKLVVEIPLLMSLNKVMLSLSLKALFVRIVCKIWPQKLLVEVTVSKMLPLPSRIVEPYMP